MSTTSAQHNQRRATRNTAGLAASARQRAETTHARVDGALEALVAEGRRVNFNAVAAAAGLTQAYLYQRDDLRRRIEALREQGQAREAVGHPRPSPTTERTKASARVLLVAKDRRIRDLEQRVRELEDQLAACRGILHDQL